MYQRSSLMVDIDLSSTSSSADNDIDNDNQSHSSLSTAPSIFFSKSKVRRKLMSTKMSFQNNNNRMSSSSSEEDASPLLLLPTSHNITNAKETKSRRNRERKEKLTTFAVLAFLTLVIAAIFNQYFLGSSSISNGYRYRNDRAPSLEEIQRQQRAMGIDPSRTLSNDDERDDEEDDPDNAIDIASLLPFDLGQRMREWLAKKQLSNGYFFAPFDDPDRPLVKRYGAKEIMNTLPHFTEELLLVVYGARSDEFIVLSPGRAERPWPRCEGGCATNVESVMHSILYAFRNRYFDRFQKGVSEDLLFLVSTGESPRLSKGCFDRPGGCGRRKAFAPVLHFGAGFGDDSILPSLVIMPPPTAPMHFLGCMARWQAHHEVCEDLEPKRAVSSEGGAAETTKGLVFGEHIGYNAGGMENAKERGGVVWEDLIPQVVWRGADIPYYLPLLHPELRRPEYALDVEPRLKDYPRGAGGAIRALNDAYDALTPRWKAATITATAQFDADAKNSNPKRKRKVLPWADMKFTAVANEGSDEKTDIISQNEFYEGWRELGMPVVGERLSSEELAHYKYHIDLGGLGGTSTEGTIRKLAMPGLLFHHSTGARDYFHEHLVPWVHYVPVDEDLSNLKEQYEWAESNERKARKIAKAGTEFVRRMGRPEGMEELYRRHFARPLEGIMEGYRGEEEEGMSLAELLDGGGDHGNGNDKKGGLIFKEVMRCTGHNVDECPLLH